MDTPTPVRKPLLKRPLLLVILGSLLLHVVVGLVAGGIAVFRILVPEEAEIEVLPPPEAIDPQQREYKVKAMRTQRSTALPTQVPLAVAEPSDFPLPSLDTPNPDLGKTSLKARGSTENFGQGLGTGTGSGGFETLFGNTSPLAGALEGTFIDFKQDENRNEAKRAGWMDAGKDFLRTWKKREFRRYFQAPQPLYATHFYIPLISADEAPRSYGVENLVEPSHWAAVYQGRFQSREGGRYRFAGTADDVLIVGVDEEVVLSAGFPESNPSRWEPDDDPVHSGPPVSEYLPPITYGDWFEMPAGQPRDLAVIIGELPGGEFASYLFIQKEGVDYPRTGDGRPILPVFKLKEFSADDRARLAGDGYPKDLDGPVFGYF